MIMTNITVLKTVIIGTVMSIYYKTISNNYGMSIKPLLTISAGTYLGGFGH